MPQPTVLPPRRATLRDLSSFLARHGVEVLDVGGGASPRTRRLVLGHRGSPQPSHVVAVASGEESLGAIERESRHLGQLQAMLGPAALTTIPAVVERLDVSGQPALAMTAVPGLHVLSRSGAGIVRPVTVDQATAVLRWLEVLWQDTAGPDTEVTLGREAVDELVARYAGVTGVADTLGALHRARHRLAGLVVRGTMSHRCLCPDHVFVRHGVVTGVDDWGGSEVQSDPLRDLGGWLVRSVGPQLVDVMAARTTHFRALRDYVVDGLVTVGAPPVCWREVLLLTRTEIALDQLRAGDYGAVDSLARATRALPRDRARKGRRP
jgi:hypothetical protein